MADHKLYVGIIKQFLFKSHEMTLPDHRFLLLKQWLMPQFLNDISISLISGDASFRRYFRISHQKKTYIAVDSPPDLVAIAPFLQMVEKYTAFGLAVPQVFASCEQQGFMLQEDLGNTQLGLCLTSSNAMTWYKRALLLLPSVIHMQADKENHLPFFDAKFVQKELHIFIEWLIKVHLRLNLDQSTLKMLDSVFQLLTDNALQQPTGGMHRDFHSRNLMVHNEQLYVIDFQDTVIGPVTYDAVSLIRDCYIRWPQQMVNELMQFHFNLLLQHEILASDTQFITYKRWFDLMGLQRHLKAAGIFARLYYRDNKSGYLKDIPLTLEYIADVSSEYEELSALSQWIKQIVIPSIKTIKIKEMNTKDSK